MRTLLATFAVIALSSGAQAYCYQVPNTAADGYAGNELNHTICLQNELAQSTQSRAVQTGVDAAISKLQRDVLQQRMMQQQLQVDLMRPLPLMR